MRSIEASRAIEDFMRQFPDCRATRESEKMIAKDGITYGAFVVGKPLILANERYSFLTDQSTAYLNICEQLAETYTKDPHLRTIIRKLVLQFEEPVIQTLVEEYPITTLGGVRFGTDIMVKDDGSYKTAEVNLGPVGGLSENISCQKLQTEEDFPICGNLYLDHFIWSMHSYYLKACSVMGIVPKPFKDKQVVYVENDGWFPGSFDIVDNLKKAGVNIDIVPRESLIYDSEKNEMHFMKDGEKKTIDQMILYFHIQEDLPNENATITNNGHIIAAIKNQAVIAETSVFPLIVLASKSVSCLISQIADNPEGILARRIGIDKKDLLKIKDMFTRTYNWRRSFFRSLSQNEKFNLVGYFATNNYILKSTRTDSYGGEGVFGAGNRGRKSYEDFYKSLKLEIGKVFILNTDKNLLSNLINKTFLSDIQKYLNENYRQTNEVKENPNPTSILDLLDLNNQERNDMREKLRNGIFKNNAEFDNFINDFACLLATLNGLEHNENIDLIKNNIISYLSTKLILPYIIQEKVLREVSDELRISGSVADHPSNNMSLLSSIKVVGSQVPTFSLFPVVPAQITRPSNDRTILEESKALEVEATAPLESTSLELSILPKDKKYDEVLVLMCGAGRHVKYLADNSRHIVGVDISPKFIEEAKASVGQPNITYEIADVREYVRREELKHSLDLTVLLGLGFGYLNPKEQLDLLQQIYLLSRSQGTIVFDLVDLEKFEKLLEAQGPVGMRFIRENGKTLQRLTKREITRVTEGYFAINDTTSYVVDNVSQTLSEKSVYYVPEPNTIKKRMEEIGYNNIQIIPVSDANYIGMLRNRWIVTAQK
jgi:hypothetical protein